MTKILSGVAAGIVTAFIGLCVLGAYERRRIEKPITVFTEE